MAPLFGPLASSGANIPAFPSSAPGDPAAPAGSDPAAGTSLAGTVRRRRPVYPVPPSHFTNWPPADPSGAGLVGVQTTRADRFFGPFASLGGGASGPSGL